MPSEFPVKGMCPTLWDWNRGFWGVWAEPRYRAMIIRSGPAGLQLHGGWNTLIQYAPAVTKEMVDLGFKVVWGVGADGESDERKALASERWPKVVAAAELAGACSVIINAEGPTNATQPGPGWTEHDIPQIELAIKRMRGESDMLLGHTSWPRPDWHPRYPWAPWYGEGGVDFALPQYYGPGIGLTGMKARWLACQAQWDKLREKGDLRPDLKMGAYIQAYDATDETAGACWIAQQHEMVSTWVIGAPMAEDDRRTIEACCALFRLGYHGVDSEGHTGIYRFQKAALIAPDEAVGPVTLGRLGIPTTDPVPVSAKPYGG